MKKIDLEQVTLNEGLKFLGYKTFRASHYRKTISRHGKNVGCISAHECWQYLRKTHPQYFKAR